MIEETKFLVINTPALWQKPDLDGIEVSDRGILLSKARSANNYGFKIGGFSLPFFFKGLTLDKCGCLYCFEPGRKKLVSFDRGLGYCHLVHCLSFDNPKALTQTDNNLYVIDGNNLICIAAINYQVRWEKPIGPIDIYDIACESDNVMYVLSDKGSGEKCIEKWHRNWGSELPEFKILELAIRDEHGQPFPLQNPVSIACHDKFLYVLEKNQGYHSVLKIDSNGLIIDTIILPLPQGFAAVGIAVDNDACIYVSSGVDVVLLKKDNQKFIRKGSYITRPLDSTRKGCRWYRVVLETEIPENTRVELSYFASDNLNDEPVWSPVLVNPQEALILDSRGRYIYFKLVLYSCDLGDASPVIKSLRVEFPHDSFTRYLPAVYLENEVTKDVLERYLAIFENFFKGFEKQILSAYRYLDPASAPSEFLPWLGSWLALAHDEKWPPGKLRELIKHAPYLYKMRGTRQGLTNLIKLYLDGAGDITIFENTPERSFCVLLTPVSIPNALQTVRQIVDTEKPAHTQGYVIEMGPWFHLDNHTYLGINTMLLERTFVLGASVLSRDTLLSEREWSGQTGVKARVGVDIILT